MLRRSHTAVIEKNETYTSGFETEPYECGWASEAVWFVRVMDIKGNGVALRAHAQVSPEGLTWCDTDAAPIEMTQHGMKHMPLTNFGGWLRLRVEVEGAQPQVKILVYLVLKE